MRDAPRAKGLLISHDTAGMALAGRSRTPGVLPAPHLAACHLRETRPTEGKGGGWRGGGRFRATWRLGVDAANGVLASVEEFAQPGDMDSWSDARLISAIRWDPPDERALDTLVARYWNSLFARCQLLVLDHQKASDLAQETWCRVLRARHGLKPEGNFPAYLMTIATNLWRDSNRSARRAGPMAEQWLMSLDATRPGEEGETLALVDVLPDFNSIQKEEQSRLKLDIDAALERLSPLLRDVLVARYLGGESAAEIARRYGRTEQTASGWVRRALRQMKAHIQDSAAGIPTNTAAP